LIYIKNRTIPKKVFIPGDCSYKYKWRCDLGLQTGKSSDQCKTLCDTTTGCVDVRINPDVEGVMPVNADVPLPMRI
jgi:hypothetical protein